MNIGEEFVQGRIACEVGGCTGAATVSVKDFGRLYGQGAFPTDLVQIGPIHFFCNHHKRDSRSFKRVNGQWVEEFGRA
jgi:hypothetical protein